MCSTFSKHTSKQTDRAVYACATALSWIVLPTLLTCTAEAPPADDCMGCSSAKGSCSAASFLKDCDSAVLPAYAAPWARQVQYEGSMWCSARVSCYLHVRHATTGPQTARDRVAFACGQLAVLALDEILINICSRTKMLLYLAAWRHKITSLASVQTCTWGGRSRGEGRALALVRRLWRRCIAGEASGGTGRSEGVHTAVLHWVSLRGAVACV